ncbi:MAG: cell division protein FtsZ [Chitinophagales bacterium]|nr:cell division protein FtsZ [Chitinophagales bacterium]MDW8418842.1 cell division protein FtsZ [Chitinophagales bacterium]
MESIFEFNFPKEQSSIIKVFGVGGGGSNAVNHMYEQGIVGVNFVVLNTDAQALEMSRVPNKIQLGPTITQGLGAGAKPEIGAKAAEESVEVIRDLLSKNTKMLFVTAGMGGGTGTGAAPVVARIAREMGILTVGIVTTPFWFEGKARYNAAIEGIEHLREHVDTLLIINNDKIREMYGNLRRTEAFAHANNILTTAAKSISEIITVPGEINVDFADVQTVMKNGGSAIMGHATAEGEGRALAAVRGAINSPLLNDSNIRGAKKVLVNITSGTQQVTVDEIGEIMEYVQTEANNTDIILGACDDPSLGDKLSVTIIATGFEVSGKPVYTEHRQVKVHVLPDLSSTPEPGISAPAPDPPVADVEQTVKIVAEETNQELLPNLFSETDTTSVSETTKHEQMVIEFDITREEQNIIYTETCEEGNCPDDEPAKAEEEVSPAQEVPVANQEDKYYVYVRKVDEPETKTEQKEQQMTLEERIKILSSLSYKVGTKQKMDELNTPAYKRNGIQIEENQMYSTDQSYSDYAVNNENNITNTNSFFKTKPD